MIFKHKQSRGWILSLLLRFATTHRLLGAVEAFSDFQTKGLPSLFGRRRCLMNMNIQTNPPMYITIGPPCAGKTTLLSRLQSHTGAPIRDVTLDGQPDVYVEVPTDYFLVNEYNDTDAFLRRRIQYKTLGSRIYNNETNGELRAIVQRLDGKLSSHEFTNTIQTLYTQHANSTSITNTTIDFQEMATLVIDTVEQVCRRQEGKTKISLPPCIQLFCVESLFRPHFQTNQTGVETAQEELLFHANENSTNGTIAVTWGNTNTRPREYRHALYVAATTRRPVYFIVYAQDNLPVTFSGVHLPNVGIQQLYKRNLERMLETGKYVPGRALVESHHRIHTFLTTAVGNLQRKYPNSQYYSKLDLDQELARMVNYEMLPNRTVQPRMEVKKKKPRQLARKQQQQQQQQVTRIRDSTM
jgi:hypothetical protein